MPSGLGRFLFVSVVFLPIFVTSNTLTMLSINTKMFKSIDLMLICSVIIVSCNTTKNVSLQSEYNKKLNGRTYTEIIEMLGAPDRTVPDGEGGEILIYEAEPKKNATSNSLNLSEPIKQTCIYIGENKTCYKVKTDDTRTEKTYSPTKTAILVLPLIALGVMLTFI